MNRISLDISNRFGKLFTVKFLHDYYEGGKCRELQVTPLEETKALLQRYALMYRQVDQEFWLGYREGKRLKILLDAATEPLRFSFMVFSKNPYFFNFTNIPFLRQGEILYVSNNQVSTKGKDLLLHKNKNIDAGNQLQFVPKRFEYRLAEQQEKVIIKVEDFEGNIVLEEAQNMHSLSCMVDLSDEPSGAYKLFIDGEHQLDFYASSVKGKSPVAVVEIIVNPEGNGQLLNEEGFENPTFNLVFAARSVYWKYLLSLPEKGNYEKFSLVEKDKQLKFGPATEASVNGKPSLVFTSQEAAPLKEIPDKQVQLKFNRNGGQIAKFNLLLPGASAERLTPNESGAFDSKIYINI